MRERRRVIRNAPMVSDLEVATTRPSLAEICASEIGTSLFGDRFSRITAPRSVIGRFRTAITSRMIAAPVRAAINTVVSFDIRGRGIIELPGSGIASISIYNAIEVSEGNSHDI